MRLVVPALALAASLAAADPPPVALQEQARAAMEAAVDVQRRSAAETFGAALESQRAALDRARDQQRAAALPQVSNPEPAGGGGFFSLPWSGMLLAPPAALPVPLCRPMPRSEIDALLNVAAQREGLGLDLLSAVVHQESGFRPCAVSDKGAMGLMQLMPATAGQFGVRDPFDPRENIDAGARLLKQLVTRYAGNLGLALGAYNAGPARVDAAGAVPRIQETQRYVSDILSALAAR
jgi:soluble lytic murein transglycosylase-like protein